MAPRSLYSVTFRDGRVKGFRTLSGAIRAARPGAVVTTAKGVIVSITYGAGRMQ